MKRLFLVGGLLLLLANSASAFELGGEYFLVKDKTISALEIGGRVSQTSIFPWIWVSYSPTRRNQSRGEWLFWEARQLHVHVQLILVLRQDLRWFRLLKLYGINSEESHAACVLVN